MFARKVAVRLKPNSLTEFLNLVQCEILPWLRKRKGFLDLIILAVPDGTEITALSFWDRSADAQAFNSRGYPETLETLERLLDGIPYVKTFDVVGSTLQKVAFERPTEAYDLREETGAAQRDYSA